MTYNNKHLNQIQIIENLIAETKSSLKSWASQISKYHKTLKELTNQVEAIKEQIAMNRPNLNQPNKTNK